MTTPSLVPTVVGRAHLVAAWESLDDLESALSNATDEEIAEIASALIDDRAAAEAAGVNVTPLDQALAETLAAVWTTLPPETQELLIAIFGEIIFDDDVPPPPVPAPATEPPPSPQPAPEPSPSPAETTTPPPTETTTPPPTETTTETTTTTPTETETTTPPPTETDDAATDRDHDAATDRDHDAADDDQDQDHDRDHDDRDHARPRPRRRTTETTTTPPTETTTTPPTETTTPTTETTTRRRPRPRRRRRPRPRPRRRQGKAKRKARRCWSCPSRSRCCSRSPGGRVDARTAAPRIRMSLAARESPLELRYSLRVWRSASDSGHRASSRPRRSARSARTVVVSDSPG